MMRIFVDANVFLRFFTYDDQGQHARATRLFKEAADQTIGLVTGPPVLFEVAWTLYAAYKLPHENVLEVLSRILTLPGLEVTDASLVERALQLARGKRVEFADSYIAASVQTLGADAVATFNRKDFQRLDSVLHAI
jgi:predicted nucleic acid-binding protein